MNVAPLHIGSLTVPVPTILAPMAGYTKAPFRAICLKHHCGLVFTEVLTAEGVRRRVPVTMHYLEHLPEERPLAAHLYGATPESLAGAAEVVESLGGFDLIDLNCGCPVPKIMKKGAGAALMREPEKIRAIIHAMHQAVSLPITLKTRLGLSRESFNISEVAQAAEEGGAAAIFIHARFASEVHSGPAHLDALKRIKEERAIPVIGNGGISAAQDALDMMAQTGVDAVMVGRGAIGNPWIFQEIHCLLSGRPFHPPSIAERREIILEHLYRLHEYVLTQDRYRKRRRSDPERTTCRKFLKHLVKYLSGMRGWRALQARLMEIEDLQTAVNAMDQVLSAQQADERMRTV